MVSLSRFTLRGIAAVGALAGFAAFTLPNAQAAQNSGTTSAATTAATAATETPVTTIDGQPLVIGSPPAGTGLSVKSSTLNAVRYNPIYKTGRVIPSTTCRQANVSMRTYAGVVAYEKALLKCLYSSWAPTLKQAGKAYKVAPTLIVHNSSVVTSYCGTVRGGTAFFCGYNGKAWIYIPAYTIINYWKQSPTFAQAYATFTLSHEYGHHVQWLAGILNASWARQQAFSTYSAQLEESRRRELQASCLAGVIDGANKYYYPITGALYQQWINVVSHSGDQPGGVRDHGSIKNHNFWSQAGFYAQSKSTYVNRCNLWNQTSAYVA
jgi:predicted metalloprotease